ncbi:MAG: hypothetical protein NC039_03425 [Muribaculaceae bacterium]|nr:hypothetical protein [Muribaculaceae bacterium]
MKTRDLLLALAAVIFVIQIVMWITGEIGKFGFICDAVAFAAFIGLYCSSAKKKE